MDRNQRIEWTTRLLIDFGWSEERARVNAIESVDGDEPVLETYSFYAIAESILAPIHDHSWITERDPDWDGDELIVRLLESGASPEDLAKFARIMQRQYLSNLACVLEGSGIYGTPDVAFNEFRIFAVDDESTPLAMIEDLHEELSFPGWDDEIKTSRRYDNRPSE